jgi:hypothetical protein
VADASPHGRAALRFAARIAHQKECELYALIAPADANSSDPADAIDAKVPGESPHAQILADVAGMVGRRLHSEILPALDSEPVAQRSKDGLVIIASSLADHLEYRRDGLGDGRAVVLVQGTESSDSTAHAPAELRRDQPQGLAGEK